MEISKALFANLRTAVQAVVNRTCIVSYGIIKGFVSDEFDGVVEVEISVADDENDVEVITCVYAGLASQALTVHIKPVIGDKVLVLFPNKFDPEMFDKDKDEAIISESPRGYDLFAGIALPINQYKENDHRTVVKVEDGVLSARLPYGDDDNADIITAQTDSEGTMVLDIAKDSDEESSDLVTLSVDQKGNASLVLQQGDVSTINVLSEGKLEYSVGDSNKLTADLSGDNIVLSDSNSATITSSSSGLTIEDTNSCTIKTSSEGIVINGNLKVKK